MATRILFDPRVDLPDGTTGSSPVIVEATPTGIRADGSVFVLPTTLSFTISTAADQLLLAAPAASWGWNLAVRRAGAMLYGASQAGSVLARRTVTWTDAASVTWADLTDLDPATLEPTPDASASWTATQELAQAAKDAVDALKAGAPGALDTFLELATQLQADESGAAALAALVGTKAPLASPALTGTPTVPTVAGSTDSSTKAASTAFVQAVAAALGTSVAATYATKQIHGRELAPLRSAVRQAMPSAIAPTRTWGDAGTASQISSAPYGKVIDVVAGGLVRVVGMPASYLVHPAGGYPNDSLYRPVGVLAPDQNGNTAARWYGIEFLCDSPQIEIWYFNRGGFTYRVWVDDLVVNGLIPSTVAGTAGNLESILIDFTTVGGMKERKIRFEATGWDLFGIGMPIPAGQSATQYTLSPTAARPVLLGIADSLFGGSGSSTSALYSIPTIIGEVLGIDGHNAGIGGTGYVTPAGGYANTAPQQATALAQSYAATPPDIILIAHGHNDGTGTTAVTTAAQQTAQTLRTAFPNAFIVGSGPLGRYPGATGADSEVALEAAIYAGLNPYIDAWVPQVSASMRPWVWGTGTTASPTGVGNADFYIPGTGGDPTHWGDAGINYVAERFAKKIVAAIPR